MRHGSKLNATAQAIRPVLGLPLLLARLAAEAIDRRPVEVGPPVLAMPSAAQCLPPEVERPVEVLGEVWPDGPIDYVPADCACDFPIDEPIPFTLPDRDPFERALTLVTAGMALRRAARECNVPESTLRGRVRRARASGRV